MPKFDKNTGFTMTMGDHSGSDETSPFSMRDTALMKAAPLYKEGDKDSLTDSEVANFKSDMGRYNPTVTSYEGDAFVGTTGSGQRQPTGKKVEGFSKEGGQTKYVRGIVTGSSNTQSEQDSKIKGASYSS